MSESVPFAPRPRAARRHAPSFDVDNFLHELNVITHRVERVAAVPVEAFSADCPEYDSACMVIIRLAAFLERDEYAPYMDALTSAYDSQHSGAFGVSEHGRPAPVDGRHSQRARHDRAPARRGLTRIGTALTDRL